MARHALRKERRIGDDFKVQVGRLAILWGDMEALTRTLELMKVRGPRYRAKTDVELQCDYRRERFMAERQGFEPWVPKGHT